MVIESQDKVIPEQKNKPAEITQRIIDVSVEKGITQTQIANALGKGFTSVNNWYRNPNINVPAFVIAPIAELFGVSCEYLLTGKEPAAPAVAPMQEIVQAKSPELTPAEEECLRLFRALDFEGQTMMLSEGFRYRHKMPESQKQEAIA